MPTDPQRTLSTLIHCCLHSNTVKMYLFNLNATLDAGICFVAMATNLGAVGNKLGGMNMGILVQHY